MTARRGILIILSSPSGAGKSTLAGRLMKWDDSLSFSVSATTRAPRDGEQDGREYFFRSHDEFRQMVDDGEMLEHAEVFDNLYGSPKGPVEAAISDGRDVIFDIDWQGGQQVRNSGLAEDVVSIFILPPSIVELEKRLRSRAQDSDEVIAARMKKSRDEISHWAEYDYCLINHDIDAAEQELKAILTAERLKRSRQPGLMTLVRRLNDEYEARQ
ncbi:guanylate kinase [Litoreibacter halocynthiae]|uniref:Guanylate kinase n=1 Tax=Litoreibacter halocynthiae TaxID=1242689 RepID=A0A4R7LNR0_9RHOB|nr:guanylate kinase [Litoreibacter halocynthiae]TDT77703.1 guanylate kinase [Litoreibacter halocynthiae]